MLKEAAIKDFKVKMSLQGPTTLNNTKNALIIASGLCNSWEKIAVIDTSNGVANLCHRLGKYKVYNLTPPFTPEKFITAIDTCMDNNMEVIIIDNFSNEWAGEGGILDSHKRMKGNAFYNWRDLTPAHSSIVEKILYTPVHIIATLRTKTVYNEEQQDGKKVYVKAGTKAIQRTGTTNDLTVAFEIDGQENCTALHDNTQLFNSSTSFRIGPDTGKSIAAWCNGNNTSTSTSQQNEPETKRTQQQVKEQAAACTTIEELTQLYSSYPEYQLVLKAIFTKRKKQLQKAAA